MALFGTHSGHNDGRNVKNVITCNKFFGQIDGKMFNGVFTVDNSGQNSCNKVKYIFP